MAEGTTTAEQPRGQETEQLKRVISPTVARISLAPFQPEALTGQVETSDELRRQWVEGAPDNLKKYFKAGDKISWDSRKEHTRTLTGTTAEKITAWETSFLDNAKKLLDDTSVNDTVKNQRKDALASLGITIGTTDAENLSKVQAFRAKYVHEDKSDIDAFAKDLAEGCKRDDGSVDPRVLAARLEAIKPMLSIFGTSNDAAEMVKDLTAARALTADRPNLKAVEVQVIMDQMGRQPDDRQKRRLRTLNDEYRRQNPDQPPPAPPAEPLPEVRPTDQPLSEEELTFAMKYITYNDVSPQTRDEARDYLENTARFGKEYTRELIELFQKYGRENVLAVADTRVEQLQNILRSLHMDGTDHSKSRSWYLWHAAKESYLAKHPDVQASLPNADRYHPYDPLLQLAPHAERGELDNSVSSDEGILYTQLGWEVVQFERDNPHQVLNSAAMNRGFAQRPPRPGHPNSEDQSELHRLLDILHSGEPGAHIPAYVFRDIGAIVGNYADEIPASQLILNARTAEASHRPPPRPDHTPPPGPEHTPPTPEGEPRVRVGQTVIQRDSSVMYTITDIHDGPGGRRVNLTSPSGTRVTLAYDQLEHVLTTATTSEQKRDATWRFAVESEVELKEGEFAAAKSLKNEKMGGGAHEDRVLFEPKYRAFGVFDGLGGEGDGDKAAQATKDFWSAAVKKIPDGLSAQATAAYIQSLAMELSPHIDRGMSTMTLGVIHETADGVRKLITVNIGDSRLYRLRNNTLECITIDDEYAGNEPGAEQRKTRQRDMQNVLARIDGDDDFRSLTSAQINAWTRRNEVHQALGQKRIEPVITITDVEEGDTYLLSSDGVHDNLTDKEIEEIMNREGTPLDLANKVVDRAKFKARNTDTAVSRRSKPDDISAEIIRITADMPAKTPASPATEIPSGDNIFANNFSEIEAHLETIRQLETREGRLLTAAEKWFVLNGGDQSNLRDVESVFRQYDNASTNWRWDNNYEKIQGELDQLRTDGKEGTPEFQQKVNQLRSCTLYLNSQEEVEIFLTFFNGTDDYKDIIRNFYRTHDATKPPNTHLQIDFTFLRDHKTDKWIPGIRSSRYINNPTS